MLIRHQDRLVDAADDPTRVIQIQQLDAETIGSHCTDTVGDYQPALGCLDR